MSLLTDAVIVKSTSRDLHTMPFWMFMVAVSGWVNPLIVVYLLFSVSPRFARLRFVCSLAILLCLAATFLFFVTAPFVPLAGYFLWLAGVLMILGSGFADVLSSPAPAASDTPARPGQ